MVAGTPAVYTLTGGVVTVAHTPTDFASRHSLFGSTAFYFRGTTNTASPTVSSDKAITIDFQDACRSSTITAKTITLAAVKYEVSGSETVAAFEDSVTSTYSAGICGELRITLDSAPAFLTLTADSGDPATQPFTISYDHT